MIIDYILCFYIYSALGFLLETVWARFTRQSSSTRRTLLRLPLCPVYGLGGVCMAAFSPRGVAAAYAAGFFAASAAEYAYALYYEKRFSVAWWRYDKNAGNLGGKVCVFFSLMWGFAGIAYYFWVHPAVMRILSEAGIWYKTVAAALVSVIFARDLSDTHAELEKFSRGEPSRAGEVFDFIAKIKKI